ncbi:MAG: glutamine-hydrolyzing carbamoyl-phosphate synthase small subunit [Rickettsiales bacterium]|nr:glutamine-hydrolyzing carbamoyl-phosphate synthase small subunit [Rickettsiales bacterium]
MPLIPQKNAILLLEDGTIFHGYGIGAKGETAGEICFNTSITGYQESLTDPSFHKQIITFTFPHIGNVGANKNDYESKKIFAKGLISSAEVTNPANYRAEHHFSEWLKSEGVTGICGVDTRALTRHIRLNGAQNCIIAYAEKISEINIEGLKTKLKAVPKMEGAELANEVSCDKPYIWNEGGWEQPTESFRKPKNLPYKIVAVDFGIKQNILRNLVDSGCEVQVVPAKTSAKEILDYNPDGVFLSNGPGDPSQTAKYAGSVIKEIVESDIPVFGICLGHQLLATSLGCKTIKMHQGHRGANHPVKNLNTGKVEITSQNHGFAVTRESMPRNVKETHISLFDNTNEGIELVGKDVFSVQHHPEASPGPRDAEYLFSKFTEILERRKKLVA